MMKIRPSDFKASADLALVDSTTMNQHSCTASIWDRFCLCELSVLLLAKLQSLHVYVKTPCALHLTSILWKIPQHFVVCGSQGWVRLWSIDQSGCDCQSHHHGPKQCLKRSTNSFPIISDGSSGFPLSHLLVFIILFVVWHVSWFYSNRHLLSSSRLDVIALKLGISALNTALSHNHDDKRRILIRHMKHQKYTFFSSLKSL